MDTSAEELEYPSMTDFECPYPKMTQIRQSGGVRELGESGRFLVSRYEDVEYVLRHPELFSNASHERIQPFDWPGPEGVPAELCARDGRVLNVIELDPPVHTARRERMFQLIKPARLSEYRVWIEELVEALIDKFADDGEVELISAFAHPLPTSVVIRLLGLTDDDFPWMHAWGLVE